MAATTAKSKEKSVKEMKTQIEGAKAIKSRKYFYAVGRRKTAVATVRLYEKGEGNITINQKEFTEYVKNKYLLDTVVFPMKLLGVNKAYDMTVRVVGGGSNAQAEAIRLAVAKALVSIDSTVKATLRGAGLLQRDARKVERKKFGHRKARRSPQWSKR
jgi:small subunit ribosomal protein S9